MASGDHLLRCVSYATEGIQSTSSQHGTVHEDVSSGKEAVQQLELEPSRLEGDKHMDLCLMNQLIHSRLVGISHQRDVGIGGDGFSQCG